MSDKPTILFQTSQAFKDKIGEYANQHNMSMAAVIREAIAAKIDYDLSKDVEVLGRPKRYATDDDRKAAQRDRARVDRDTMKKLLALYQREQREKDAQALQDWLDNRESKEQ